jgi:hypothetical protein
MLFEDQYCLCIEVQKCMHSVSLVSLSNLAQRCGNVRRTNTCSLFLYVYTNIESLVEVVQVPNEANPQTLIIHILCNTSYQRLDMFRGVYCEVWLRLSEFFHMVARFSLLYCFMTLAGFSFTISSIGQTLF